MIMIIIMIIIIINITVTLYKQSTYLSKRYVKKIKLSIDLALFK